MKSVKKMLMGIALIWFGIVHASVPLGQGIEYFQLDMVVPSIPIVAGLIIVFYGYHSTKNEENK